MNQDFKEFFNSLNAHGVEFLVIDVIRIWSMRKNSA